MSGVIIFSLKKLECFIPLLYSPLLLIPMRPQIVYVAQIMKGV